MEALLSAKSKQAEELDHSRLMHEELVNKSKVMEIEKERFKREQHEFEQRKSEFIKRVKDGDGLAAMEEESKGNPLAQSMVDPSSASGPLVGSARQR